MNKRRPPKSPSKHASPAPAVKPRGGTGAHAAWKKSGAAVGAGQADITRPAPLDDHARHAVFRVLVRQARHFPEFDLGAMDRIIDQEAATLDDRDRAFAYAIYDTAVRRWLTLEYLIQRSLTQPFSELEPRLKATLLGGAVQILFMDKVPTHSAINHAVEWAKIIIRPGAGAFANAVLRKVAALKPDEGSTRRDKFEGRRDEVPSLEGGAFVLREECLPEHEIERLAIATSHPLSLFQHWLASAPIREVRRIAMHSMCRPPVILNTAHARGSLDSVPVLAPHAAPGHHVFTGGAPELADLLSSRRDIWVQDPASSLAIQSIADLRPKPSLILDLCAGQGTKTRQLAATFPNARIAATDIDEPRFARLQSTFADSDQVRVMSMKTLRAEAGGLLGKADLVLLDVPCSNTGVLARRPEARYRIDEAHLKSLTDMQKQIIADAIPLLNDNQARRGKILYSTCSLESEENHKQAAWADKWHKLGVSREHQQMPDGEPGEPPYKYSDGSFSALLG